MKKEEINLEIERKFLLKDLPNVVWDEKYVITQSYCEKEGEKFRLRERYSTSKKEYEFFKTIKKKLQDGIYEEDEESLTLQQYTNLCQYETNRIHKIRHIKIEDNFTWEVDDYGKMVVAEVELESLDQNVTLPIWLSMLLVKEVTKYSEFTNHKLAKLSKNCFYNLYKEWQKDCSLMSSPSEISVHKNVQELILYLKSDISFLEEAIKDLKRTHWVGWFGILSQIAEISPVAQENAGNVEKMVADWINWYTEHIKWKILN